MKLLNLYNFPAECSVFGYKNTVDISMWFQNVLKLVRDCMCPFLLYSQYSKTVAALMTQSRKEIMHNYIVRSVFMAAESIFAKFVQILWFLQPKGEILLLPFFKV